MNKILRPVAQAYTPEELKQVLSSGLMSFPITDFDAAGDFAEAPYRERLEWLMPYGATVLFAAGGTGEGFSLTPAEQARVVRAAVETCGSDTPIIAGAGYGTRLAIEMTRAAEAAGAAGVLLMPHYLTEANQKGLAAHVEAVCKATSIGVIVYNRNVCRLSAETVAELAERNPNLIGFKDGVGDIEGVMAVRSKLGDRLSYLGGLPTAEVYAEAYNAAGFPVYSSAVFNFIPKTAMDFYAAVRSGDTATTGRLLRDFFMPYLAIRNRSQGYAVSIIKAGARIVGRPAGPVRPPLTDLTEAEEADLAALIATLGPQ
ncbi:5-dehydro-4-deoxyglucarate dehydratase [Amaricoccus solimangrovi]|uniref:Probable 5-dehydro-4-deoxyglucarate dehydratase n=1 Tax=Amaricoccus solimangrovi TaxID=2589815 RepID=A0A501WQS2_9RHOB|nr:5-dehydro-4-deoxyglucarate dehydratase [Amaricoccus solimangrovi]TPE51708.1 5-dehydro-4-deoxyglucarate dehydratase [Amaricoccus solimangrovi]